MDCCHFYIACGLDGPECKTGRTKDKPKDVIALAVCDHIYALGIAKLPLKRLFFLA